MRPGFCKAPLQVADIHKSGKYNDLPDPFNFKVATEMPVTMNLSIQKQPDGKFTVVKQLLFLQQEKVLKIEQELIRGWMFLWAAPLSVAAAVV